MHKIYYYKYEFIPKVIKLKVKDFLVLSLHLFGSMMAHPLSACSDTADHRL